MDAKQLWNQYQRQASEKGVIVTTWSSLREEQQTALQEALDLLSESDIEVTFDLVKVGIYSCNVCGAAVERDYRRTHKDWHKNQ